jgi:hypothetical protein
METSSLLPDREHKSRRFVHLFRHRAFVVSPSHTRDWSRQHTSLTELLNRLSLPGHISVSQQVEDFRKQIENKQQRAVPRLQLGRRPIDDMYVWVLAAFF